ncbi:hypothetical protein M4D55_13260 [Metabacillus idriensis]|uniref:hypothetical protein n=1 Tax=Metabacillus idriensis TaxID=324768 RepID=UPI0009F6CFFE|nr:hypothetical protein [Metabacillus idriensis]MCM3596734.1 hypothetical protein [Metabacillus idriensis]
MYYQYTPVPYSGYNDLSANHTSLYGDERQAPTFPPPQQFAQQVPQTFFSNFLPTNQIRSAMCQCIGRWGLLGLRFQSPFGRDLWFFPTEIRQNSVSGYTWQGGLSQRARYNYSEIRNFICST